MYHQRKNDQYWVWSSEYAFLNGFLPRFKCDTKEQLKSYYKQRGLIIKERNNATCSTF